LAGARTTRIITFSGIDGAGKSTQISGLESWLMRAGVRVSTLSMWDDVVVGARLREIASRCVFRGDQGIGTPQKPLSRRDKNVSAWILTLIRLAFYFVDAVNLSFTVRKIRNKRSEDVAIFDRYIYDELANLPMGQPLMRAFVRFVLWLTPTPDAAYLIDATPEAARARKPEYPLEFLHRNRRAYLSLKDIVSEMIVVESGSIEAMEETIRANFLSKMSHLRVRGEGDAVVREKVRVKR
jgi:thymidylate kinase